MAHEMKSDPDGQEATTAVPTLALKQQIQMPVCLPPNANQTATNLINSMTQHVLIVGNLICI